MSASGEGPRACRRNRIRNAVVARILDGTYPPGTRLKELALAAEFGVSQAPVREALREERAAELAVPCAADALAALQADLEILQETAGRLDFEAYAVAVLSFHRGIVQMSGNRTFLRAWDALHWEVRTRVAIRQAGTRLPFYAEAHTEVVAALRAGDGKRAGRQLRDIVDKFFLAGPSSV